MPDFGTTPVLSDFTLGPFPENPLSEDGRWEAPWPDQSPPLQKIANGIVSDSLHGPVSYSYWAQQAFHGDVEVYACMSGGQLGAAVETWRVFMWHDDPFVGNGYQVYIGGGIGNEINLRRYDDRVPTQLAQGSMGFPMRLGLRISGSRIETWVDHGAGWVADIFAVDTTYRGTFYIGCGIEDPSGGGVTFNCFGGGRPSVSQFFRWLYN